MPVQVTRKGKTLNGKCGSYFFRNILAIGMQRGVVWGGETERTVQGAGSGEWSRTQ